MSIDFALTKRQLETREAIRGLTKAVIRPQSLMWDREHGVPHEFLRTITNLAVGMGHMAIGPTDTMKPEDKPGAEKKKRTTNVNTVLAAEEMSWGDAGLLLSMPGSGLGGAPVRSTGTPEQKERFLGIFKDMSVELRWGAYALTEPSAGSDVAGIRTSCRKEGKSWVINGRKCYITNGARASWNVVFATLDPSLGRAGHRAFVVEKGTPGFSVGKVEDNWRGSSTRCLCGACRRPGSMPRHGRRGSVPMCAGCSCSRRRRPATSAAPRAGAERASSPRHASARESQWSPGKQQCVWSSVRVRPASHSRGTHPVPASPVCLRAADSAAALTAAITAPSTSIDMPYSQPAPGANTNGSAASRRMFSSRLIDGPDNPRA